MKKILCCAAFLYFPITLQADPYVSRLEMLSADKASLAIAGEKYDKLRRVKVQLDGGEVDTSWKSVNDLAVTTISVPAGGQWLSIDGPRSKPRAVQIGTSKSPFDQLTIYHLWLGMFNNANPENDMAGMFGWVNDDYSGGDLQGVLDKVDYIASTGVNAVWFSPVFASGTSHGYDATNYYRIGKAVGDKDAQKAMKIFEQVRDALHERGIKVYLDLALNHAAGAYSRKAGDPKQFKPKHTKARSPDEKTWESWGTNYLFWNFRNENTREFLKDVARFWLEEGKVDGFRFDYVKGIPESFWEELYPYLKGIKPDVYLVGEAWDRTRVIQDYYQSDDSKPLFDSLLDFPMQSELVSTFARGNSFEYFIGEWQEIMGAYGALGRPALFLDNHDLERFMSWTNDEKRLEMAMAFLATQSNPIIMFYGTEVGLRNKRPSSGFTDDGRITMPWGNLDKNLLNMTSGLLQLRKAHPVFSQGNLLPVYVAPDQLAYTKQYKDSRILVLFNHANHEFDFARVLDEVSAKGVLWGKDKSLTVDGSGVKILLL